MEELGKDELLELLAEYDRYIQAANEDDRYSEGWYPVCIDEFYHNELLILQGELEDSWEM